MGWRVLNETLLHSTGCNEQQDLENSIRNLTALSKFIAHVNTGTQVLGSKIVAWYFD